MTTATPDTAPTTAPICSDCAAPMAEDQRYCLDCGRRRADVAAPVASREPAAMPATKVTPAARGPRGPLGWLTGNAAIVGGVACLLLAMGVGVLIGRAGRTPAKVAAPPQVVTVAGAAGAAAPTKTAKVPSSAKKKKASGSNSKPAASVKDLSNTTNPSDYAKKSKKLPSVVGTGGKPPPKDKKKAGGGTDFEEIG